MDHLASCYFKDYMLKLSYDVCKVAFSGIVGNVIVNLFLGQAPDLLCYLYGTVKEIDNSIEKEW